MRKLRILLAAVFFIGITLLLVGIGQQWWGWMAKLQFLPSCLALNFAVIAGTLLVTLLLGRLYCSVICPLGILQDLIIKLNRKKKFKFSPEKAWLRYALLIAFVVAAVVFGQVFIAIVAPYSAYGRIVSAVCASVAGSAGVALIVVAAVTLVVIGLCAFFGGRTWCNTVCPVGSALALFSRLALWRPVIDKAKCVGCKQCAKKCKCACIDPENHAIDMSRCVVCFDCLGNCKVGAISYRFVGFRGGKAAPVAPEKPAAASSKAAPVEAPSPEKAAAPVDASEKTPAQEKPADEGRRNFLAGAALVIGSGIAAKAQDVNKHLDGGLAEITPKAAPERAERIVPPGAQSVKHFYDTCTSCQLCVQNCPNDVLRPSTDFEHLLQPQMGFEKGYCRPECTVCGELCPAGAILPVKREEKLNIKIGVAKVNLDLCFAAQGEAGCGNCAHHCPSGAVRMLRSEGYKFAIPVVMEEQCIGCGACEHLCPVRPISAITVDGISTHHNK